MVINRNSRVNFQPILLEQKPYLKVLLDARKKKEMLPCRTCCQAVPHTWPSHPNCFTSTLITNKVYLLTSPIFTVNFLPTAVPEANSTFSGLIFLIRLPINP